MHKTTVYSRGCDLKVGGCIWGSFPRPLFAIYSLTLLPKPTPRVFWNTEPLLRNGERKVSDEFSLRPTRDPSARRRKLTPDAKHPSSHPRLRRPKGALCSPIVRHGFANQHEAQMETVPVGDIKPPELKPQTDAINSEPSRPH